MKKKRTKKSKFKIPSKPGKKKIVEEKFEVEEEIKDSDEFSPEVNSFVKNFERAIDFYQATMRHFFNLIVPRNLKVDADTEFFKIFEVNDYEFFGLATVGDNALFSFMGSKEKLPPELILKILINDTSQAFYHPRPSFEQALFDYLEYFRMKGFDPESRKVLCIVQEEPTKEFLNRDEIVINRNNKFFMDFAGKSAYDIIDSFKKNLGTTNVLVKVINKENNPEAYKDYLRLKQILTKMRDLKEDFEISLV